MGGDYAMQPAADGGTQSLPEPHSAEWWHSRSTDELRKIIAGGFEMGETFDAASAEAERRASEQLKHAEEARKAEALRKKELRRRILETFLLASLIGLIATVLIGQV